MQQSLGVTESIFFQESVWSFVCIKHRVSMLFKSSLMGFVCIKNELF